MEDKQMPGFMTFREGAVIYTILPDEDAGRLVKAAAVYYLNGTEPDLPEQLRSAFTVMQSGVEHGRESWEKRRMHGKRAAEARWNRREEDGEADARACPGMPENTNLNLNSNLNLNQNRSTNTNTSINAGGPASARARTAAAEGTGRGRTRKRRPADDEYDF